MSSGVMSAGAILSFLACTVKRATKKNSLRTYNRLHTTSNTTGQQHEGHKHEPGWSRGPECRLPPIRLSEQLVLLCLERAMKAPIREGNDAPVGKERRAADSNQPVQYSDTARYRIGRLLEL